MLDAGNAQTVHQQGEGFTGTQRVTRMPGVNLELALGSRAILQVAGTGQKGEARVVGMDPYAYIILRTRMTGETCRRLILDDRVTVQYVHQGTVYGFRTNVLNVQHNPAQLVFIQYPDVVEKLDLRGEERVPCSLPGSVDGRYGEHKCVVQDLTTGGCRISVRIKANYSIRRVSVDEEMQLSLDLSNAGSLRTPICVRSVSSEKGLLQMGTMFMALEQGERDQISTFLDDLTQHTA